MRQQLLGVVAGTQYRLVVIGREGHKIRRPIVPIEVLEAWAVRRHPDYIWISLRANQVDGFGDRGQESLIRHMLVNRVGKVDSSRWSVDLVHAVLSGEDCDIPVASGLLPVVEEVELFQEKGRFFVMMSVPHTACWDDDVVFVVLVVSCRYECDIGICLFQALVKDVWLNQASLPISM